MKSAEKLTQRLREARATAASIRAERQDAIERGDIPGISDSDSDLRVAECEIAVLAWVLS